MAIVKRGYVQTDSRDFSEKSIEILKEAQKDIYYLLNRDYPIKNAVTFVGNRYLLSERQRTALQRATSSRDAIKNRITKLSKSGGTAWIDGLNLIITLEVALSGSTLIRCMDGTIRDLAGLRGTYRLIDKTDTAIKLIADKIEECEFSEAIFYLDKPVSNTGRLKQRIYEITEKYPFKTTVELADNVDTILEGKENVVTSDAIILDRCKSWFNFSEEIVSIIETAEPIDLSGGL